MNKMNFSIFKVYQIENNDIQFYLQINLKNEKDFKCNLQFKNKLEIDGFPSVIINPNFSFETDDVDENKVKIDFNMTHEIFKSETPESQFIKNENTFTEESNPESDQESDQESNPESKPESNSESNPESDQESNPESNPESDQESNVLSDIQQNLNSENIILSREEELDNISEEFRDEINKKFHYEENENKQLVDVITNFNKHLDYIMLKLESGEKFGNQITESDEEIKPNPPQEIIKSPRPPKEINTHPPQEIIKSPRPPKEIKPHPPQEISKSPHPPKEIKPHPPQEISKSPHPPKEIKPHPPQEIENIPNHKKKINDVINEIQKSDICNNVESNLIEIIIKHMTSIEGYNIAGEEKKNLVLNSIESMLLSNDNKNKNILLILSSKLIDTFIAFDKHKINIEDRNNYLSCFGCR
jgi:hypothetical protein